MGTFEAARDSGNALLAQVKANQPILLATLQGIAADQPPAGRFETVDRKSHGRQEHRLVDPKGSAAKPSMSRANSTPSGTA